MQGYWVWGKLFEALADVGYDTNNLVPLPYDWRLSMQNMEARDAWFTRARCQVVPGAHLSSRGHAKLRQTLTRLPTQPLHLLRRHTIEVLVALNQEKVVLCAHSYGER